MKIAIPLAVLVIGSLFSFNNIPGNTSQVTTVKKYVQPSFSFVRGHRQGKGTTVTWAMSTNDNITGFDIECTNQDPNDQYSVWEYKGSVSNLGRMLKFNDPNVLPGILNYRIVAWLNDGTSVVSATETIRLVSR